MNWDMNSVTPIGMAYQRHGSFPFGIRLRDRLQHIYIIGQTGTGKSTLLYHLMQQDLRQGHGFCLIDPHGDLRVRLPSIAQAAPSSGMPQIPIALMATTL